MKPLLLIVKRVPRGAAGLRLGFALLLAGQVAGCDLITPREKEAEDPMAEAQRHLQRFIEEAETRGKNVRHVVQGLEISFQEKIVVDGRTYCGYVPLTPAGAYSNRVQFSSNPDCWGSNTAWDRETLVFHELGHAVLDRWHRDAKLPNGASASIMVTKNPFAFYNDRTLERRRYYVDELFDEKTAAPEWSR